jgi:hypothetical protein
MLVMLSFKTAICSGESWKGLAKYALKVSMRVLKHLLTNNELVVVDPSRISTCLGGSIACLENSACFAINQYQNHYVIAYFCIIFYK